MRSERPLLLQRPRISISMEGMDICQLSALLGVAEESSGRVIRSGGVPGDDGATVIRSGAALEKAPEDAKAGNQSAASIWDANEVPEGAELDDVDDPRPQPEYTINFRQDVSPEDVFLQLGNKTPGTASCECLVIRVRLPGETASTTTVDLQQRHLDVRAYRWRLSLFLPHPVKEKEAKARWEGEVLEVVARVSRELDALNF